MFAENELVREIQKVSVDGKYSLVQVRINRPFAEPNCQQSVLYSPAINIPTSVAGEAIRAYDKFVEK